MIPSPRALIPFCLVALLVVAGVHWAWRKDPFGSSLGDQISAGYTGVSLQALDAHGLAAKRATWSLVFSHDNPEVRYSYINHPAWPLLLHHGVARVLGSSLETMRVTSFLLLVMALIAMAWVLPRDPRSTSAWLFLITSATIVARGPLACPPYFGMPWILMSAALYFRYRNAPSKGRCSLYFVAAFLAALSDWNSSGVVVAIWIDLLLFRPKEGWRLRHAMLLALPFAIGAAFNVAHAVWALGGFAAVISQLLEIVEILGPHGDDALSFARRFGSYVVLGHGWPLLVLSGLGLLSAGFAALRGRCSEWGRRGTFLAIAGLVPCAVFFSRSGTHDFWIVLLTPAVAMLAAEGMELVRRLLRLRETSWVLTVLFLLVATASFGHSLKVADSVATDRYAERGRVLDTHFEPRDVLFFPDYDASFATRFFAHSTLIPQIRSPELLTRALKTLQPGLSGLGRVYFVLPEAAREEMGWTLGLPRGGSPPRTLKIHDLEVVVAELDRDRLFAELR